jgi:pimeloyl-ACP methyl ester carboxylesterase
VARVLTLPEQFHEREFAVPGFGIAAKEWGAAGGRPIIAAHGWLDNAGSFDLLAPLLTGCHLIALDAAGHGLSGNRSPDASYNLWQEVGDLVDVAGQLGWTRFSLLGHSRGAAVATLLAGTFPEMIDSLVLLEGGIPILGSAADAPLQLAESLVETRRRRGGAGRVFADRGTAIRERAEGFSPVMLETAEILARRSLREVDGGFQWHADQRLKAKSELRLTAEHAEAFIARITAPVLVIMAEQSPFGNAPAYLRLVERFANAEIVRLPGGHHFHLEGAESEIARRMLDFLGRQAMPRT